MMVGTNPPKATAGDRDRLRESRKQILVETAERLARGEDPDTVVMPALFKAMVAERIVDATLGYIVTEMGRGMKLGFMEGFDRKMMQRCLTLDFGQAICGRVAATREPMHVGDIQRTLDPMADLVRSAGINAYACEPLIVGDCLLGTISFASRTRRSFEAEDLLFFQKIAKMVALARSRKKAPPVIA